MGRKIARTLRAGVLSISDKPLKKMKERSKVIPGEEQSVGEVKFLSTRNITLEGS